MPVCSLSIGLANSVLEFGILLITLAVLLLDDDSEN
jgi:hypothetical protein